ncbi:MAG: hypothetical protein OXH66_03470 [Gemmatimonadetes bacterium]|nr:hypothetical protein [Gemmatimonadota bacterium]
MFRPPAAASLLFVLACAEETIAPDEPPPNRHPVLVRGIPAQTLWHGATRVDMELTGAFSDPEGNALAYTVASSDTTIVPVALHPGPVVSLAGPLQGEATVTVTARDPEGLEAQAAFPVAVVENPDRATLVQIFEETGGTIEPDKWWPYRDNWATDAKLDDWYGVGVNDAGRVSCLGECDDARRLALRARCWGEGVGCTDYPYPLANRQSRYLGDEYGLPPALGDLEALEELRIAVDRLQIPPALGRLRNLRVLRLSDGAGSVQGPHGPIPPELGNLSNLVELVVDGGWWLTGVIPPELGRLSNLRSLVIRGDLRRRGTTHGVPHGLIPPELGNLAHLENLEIQGGMIGTIPPELGRLTNLSRRLWIKGELTGPIPAELGGLTGLRSLRLAGLHLSGPIPSELQNLESLDSLYISQGTGELCVLSEPVRQWLARFSPDWVLRLCDTSLRAAHLVQAVQSREPTVPLVAGEPAALRLFGMSPPLQARFYLDGAEVHEEQIARLAFDAVPGVQTAGTYANMSAEALVPGSIVRPGLEFVIEGDGSRFPPEGRQAVDVREVPPFSLTLVPILLKEDGQLNQTSAALVAVADSMVADPEGSWRLQGVRELLPIEIMQVNAHPPVVIDMDTIGGLNYQALSAVAALAAMDGGTGHWMGLGNALGPVFTRGVASQGGRASVVTHPTPLVIAHELGHNFSLGHVSPSSDPWFDPHYPHTGGGHRCVGIRDARLA